MKLAFFRSAATTATVAATLTLAGCTGTSNEQSSDPSPEPRPSTATSPASPAAPTAGEQLFILDNDWSPYTGGDALVLMAAPDAKLLGTTTVTGDAWAPQGTASALSFMEAVGIDDVPVAEGQVYPLLNTPRRAYAWQGMYGGQGAWLGAFNRSEDDPSVPAVSDPWDVSKPVVGWPKTLGPDQKDAIEFLIDAVHQNPGRVTIVTTGPLTNIAAAIRRDPTFSMATKGIVIGGGNLYQLSPGEVDPEFNSSEGFNFRFDAESAHIALTAKWPSITVVGDATDSVLFDEDLMKQITENKTPASDFIKQVGYVGYPIWDETTAAVAVDPSLIEESIPLRMDIDISEGANYGQTRVWADGDSPGLGESLVTYVQSVDTEGVADLFVKATHQ